MGTAAVRGGSAALLVTAILGFYCCVGMIGFDPSKQDEGYIFGIVLEFLHGKSWIVPTLAGDPFLEKPPLYYLVAAATARFFSPWLALHDGARLASGLFTALTGTLLAQSARLLWGPGHGRFAVVALFGSFGFIFTSHMLLTDNAKLTGMALALLGLAGVARGKRWAGVALGTGAGIAFMSKGLFGPGVIALTVVLLLAFFREWRTRAVFRSLLYAAAVCLPWLVIWPALLYHTSPAYFRDWFWLNNLGRFLGFSARQLYTVHEGDFWYRVLPWATFPALPLALVTLYRLHRANVAPANTTFLRHPAIQIALAFTAALGLVMSSAASIRAIYALPWLLVLSLLAAPSLRYPPRWMSRLLIGGGAVLFTAFALGSLVLWTILALGYQPPLRALFERWLVPGFGMPVRWRDGLIAVGLCLLWGVCVLLLRRSARCAAGVWMLSIVVVMAVVARLWIPWVCASKSSYRALYEQMAPYLPREGCIASRGLGESQRGMLDYVLNVQTIRKEVIPHRPCAALLVDGSTRKVPEPRGWSLIWSGMRAPDDHEKFWLFVPDPVAKGGVR